MSHRTLRWLGGLAGGVVMIGLMAQVVYYYVTRHYQTTCAPPVHPQWCAKQSLPTSYPWGRVDFVVYTHLCALLICIIWGLIAFAIYATVKLYQEKHRPLSTQRSPGVTTKFYVTYEQRIQLSQDYLLSMAGICLLIVTLSILVAALLP